jgi:hypothetical protein
MYKKDTFEDVVRIHNDGNAGEECWFFKRMFIVFLLFSK